MYTQADPMVLVVYSLVDFRNSKQIVVVWKQSDNLVESLKYDEMCHATKPDCVLSLNVHFASFYHL